MIKTFIERPVLSTVISIIIVLLGILGLVTLPITQYPDIAPPTVQISATYTGANAETVMNSVVIPIEEQVNGVEGMTYITSTAGNDGGATIDVYFEQGVDPDIAAVNVQNRVARATPLLPAEVTRTGVTTQKQQTSALMFVSFYTTSEEYNDVFLQNYMSINVVPILKRIKGVGSANVFGAKDYSMRVWLDPTKLAAHNLVPDDVVMALNEQSLEAAAGQLGENSGQAFQYVLKYKGKYKTEKEYQDIVIKAMPNGQLLRLKDVAKIELDALSYSVVARNDGHPAVALGIYQTAGSNAREIINNIKEELAKIETEMPEGLHYTINFDTNEFLEASISSVTSTLIEAMILVFLVVFVFLQDVRSTIIPAIAVPVSIIGTFFFLQLFGYSINLLTLFALVLAIGIVVDDAIVVVEAVHAKIENTGKPAREATTEAMGEITGAIISITLVMAAVFIPVTFITGPTGVFYQQFGITLIVAIVISAVNALTLSPALCALFLKSSSGEHERKRNLLQRFYDAFNAGFSAITKRYAQTFLFLFRYKWVTGVIIISSLAAIWYLNKITPTGFVPDEDRGIIFANIELAPGSSVDRAYQVTAEFRKKAMQIPGVTGITFVNGFSFIGGAGSNNSLGFIKLDEFNKRKNNPGQDVKSVTGQLFGLASTMPEAQMIFFAPPSVPGFGISSGFDLSVLDRTGGDVRELEKVKNNFIMELMKRPEIMYAQSSFNTNYPQYEIELNVERAKESGVTVNSVFSALQGYVGGLYATDFNRFGKQFRVMVQALPEDRINEKSLDNIYVRTASGEMSPVTQFVSLKRVYGPQSINRFNLFTSAGVSGASKPGYSSGDAIKAVEEVAATGLPIGYGIDYAGLTREEISSGSQTFVIFMLCLIFIYFILSAQYESYLLPFAVILSLPLGIMGAYLAQNLAGLENNIYFQIALIMLVGLLAKNGILIVEFAVQRRRHGETIAMSAINAAKARLRPILMTSFAFIFGMIPLVFSSGIGYVGNRSIGTGAAFGLLIGTLLGVIVIPVLYIIFQTLQEKIVPMKFSTHNQEKITNEKI